MLEKVLIFVVFLFPLVFFHELGHFLFARLFGVRVEVFSLGFGPKLLKFVRGGTEYCFSLIPLGGYVKMFGDDPMKKDSIPEEDRKYSFTHKGKWARFWIVFGGPLANFIFTYFIFFFLLMAGEKVPEVKLGVLEKGNTLFEKGLRTGDVVQEINGQEIFSITDIPMGTTDNIDRVSVSRNGLQKTLEVNMLREKFFKSMISLEPILRQPTLKNPKNETLIISKINGMKIESLSLDEISDLDIESIVLDNTTTKKQIEFSINSKNRDEFFNSLRANKLYPIDLAVKSVNMDSAADKAGISGGDILLAINGKEINSFFELRNFLNAKEQETYSIKVLKDGQEVEKSIVPEVQEIQGKKLRLIGVYSDGAWVTPKFVETASKGLVGSGIVAYERTIDAILKTFIGFKKLITSEVSIKNIGGPLSIGQVAAESFKTSLSYFFQIMALISVNLGVINLFPIPVLDGGHIMFIIMEIFNRGPLSRRKMEIAQQFGLSLLLLLTVAALYNDFSRLF